MKMKIYRQGDVLLVQVKSLPKDVQQIETKEPFTVIKYGEVTGHKHQVDTHKAKLWSAAGERFLQVVSRECMLAHNEHATLEIPPGIYQVPEQVEYQKRELVRVSD
jgi:hypothetical protein